MAGREPSTYDDNLRGNPSTDVNERAKTVTNRGSGLAAGVVSGAWRSRPGDRNARAWERGASRSGREPNGDQEEAPGRGGGEASLSAAWHGKAVVARSDVSGGAEA